jgi:hypothetical protein
MFAVSAPLNAHILERICPGFERNARRTELAKERPSFAAASWMCDGSHICRRASGLGFNSREVLWRDLVRQPLVTSRRSSTPAENPS